MDFMLGFILCVDFTETHALFLDNFCWLLLYLFLLYLQIHHVVSTKIAPYFMICDFYSFGFN